MFNSRKKPEIVLSKPVRSVVVKVHQYSIADGKIEEQITDEVTSVGATGESVDVDNPLITDANRAHVVGAWVGNYLKNRMSLEVEWRADTRLDALDIVKVANDYGNTLARMTDVTFKFNGAFQGSGKGSVI